MSGGMTNDTSVTPREVVREDSGRSEQLKPVSWGGDAGRCRCTSLQLHPRRQRSREGGASSTSRRIHVQSRKRRNLHFKASAAEKLFVPLKDNKNPPITCNYVCVCVCVLF